MNERARREARKNLARARKSLEVMSPESYKAGWFFAGVSVTNALVAVVLLILEMSIVLVVIHGSLFALCTPLSWFLIREHGAPR